MRSFFKSLSFFALPLLFACDQPRQSDANWAGSVRDSAGVHIVANTGVGIWTEETEWSVEEDLRIGTLDDDPAYQFGDVYGIGVSSSGNILVLDVQADDFLRVYSRDGTWLSGSGREGSGPGELSSSAGPILSSGDSLFVIPDGGNSRISVFSDSGQFRRSIPVTLTELVNSYGATSGGLPVLQVGLSAMPGMETNDDLVDVLLWIGPDGSSRDTLLVFPSGRQFIFEGGMPELTFFAPEPSWTIASNDAIVLGINNEYSITSFFDGSPQRIVRKDSPSVLLIERDRQVVLESWIRIFEERIPNADVTLRQLAQFYEQFPAFNRFLVDGDGYLWVQKILIPSSLTDEEAENHDPTRGWGSNVWDLFDPEGRFLGEITFPKRFDLHVVKRDYVVGIWRDELDVQYVMRLRIVR